MTADTLERDTEELLAMLAEALRELRREIPSRDPLVLEREKKEMAEACSIFMRYEAERQTVGEPVHLEVALGGARTKKTPWDREEPVELEAAEGLRLRLAGRVDRIDRLDAGGLVIFDYKTGASKYFSPSDPFRRGRHLQHLLYARMLEATLDDLGRPEPVSGFSYFFPMARDEGRTIAYDRQILNDEGRDILADLARLLASGCFPFTSDGKDLDDMKYSDYLPIYGDCGELAKAASGKLRDPALAPWARLRGLEEKE